MKSGFAVSLGLMALAAAQAHAQDAQPCFDPIPLTAQLVADAGEDMTYSPASGDRPAFLVGHLSYLRESAQPPEGDDSDFEIPPHGAVLFVKGAAGWTAHMPSDGESSVGVYASTVSPLAIVLTQLQVEGPGQSFTVARSTDGFKSTSCTLIEFPDALNNPGWAMEYVSPLGMQMDAKGRGKLVGSAELDDETDKPVESWWRWTTRNGGKSWSKPKRLKAKDPLGPGILTEITAPAPPEVLADLKGTAQGK